MDGGTVVFLIAFAIIGTFVQFFFLRAIIISAMKQVFINLQSENAAIRVVAVENPDPLTNSADVTEARPRAPVKTANALITSSGKVFQRKPNDDKS